MVELTWGVTSSCSCPGATLPISSGGGSLHRREIFINYIIDVVLYSKCHVGSVSETTLMRLSMPKKCRKRRQENKQVLIINIKFPVELIRYELIDVDQVLKKEHEVCSAPGACEPEGVSSATQ